MKPFNNLTPAEAERLAWLIEECSEVQKAATKILRHGYESHDPSNPDHKGNRADLVEELADLTASVLLMDHKGDINLSDILSEAEKKHGGRYMHHQEE